MIGICTPYKIANYGTKLQAYAVQKKIEQLGYDYEIINFNRKSDMRINKLFARYVNKDFVQTKIKRRFTKKTGNLHINSYDKKIRKDAINSFDKTHYKLTSEIKGYKNLKKYSEKFDALICGSDQIWLPTSINNPTATLEFGDDNTRKIAFAPSFGISSIPNNKKNRYKKFLKKIDYISVRENTGADIIKALIGNNAKVVLDPTLTLNKEVWDKLSEDGRIKIQEKYIFCYFLGNNEEHRKAVYNYAKENNLKIVTLPHFKQYNKCDEELTDIGLYDVTPCDFIYLIKNAELVCTDSFHATVFSIIFHKMFFTFERFRKSDTKSANSRLHSLLGLLDLKNRIISEENNYTMFKEDIDYESVETRLNELRKETDEYLIEALNGLEKKKECEKTFEPLEKKNCCGCTACVSICPQKCIKMIEDEETGFHYPVIYKPENCIHCGLCNLTCPNKQERNIAHSVKDAKYIISNNEQIRKNSSSGGVFYHIAKYVLEHNGLVCGAKYDEKFDVIHTIIDNEEDLESLMKSKYSESNLSDVFIRIKNHLEDGKLILFTGTPCQAYGLKCFLRKDYDNLIIMDLLCYGIQSPKAWKKYKEYITKDQKEIKSINMRDKSISWQNYSMKIEFNNGEIYEKSKEQDPYLKTYSKGLFVRPSCYSCTLKAFPRASDITVGDFWDIDKIMPEENDKKGAGLIIINTDKGKKIINNLEANSIFSIKSIEDETLKKVHPLFGTASKRNKKSKKFFKLLQTNMSFDKIAKKCEMSVFEKGMRKTYKKIKKIVRKK